MFVLLNVTVFLGAFLLFSIELIVANALLPGFGGSYLVWSSCMMFFQGVLLLGYLYANLYRRKPDLRLPFVFHVALVFLPLLFFPVSLDRFLQPSYARPMIVEIIGLLFLTIGFAFWILSSTSVILQRVLASSASTRRMNPYVLYAVSNLGSVAALLAYPLVVTPLFDLQSQISGWQIGYLLFALCHLLILIPNRYPVPQVPAQDVQRKPALPKAQIVRWMLPAAAASAMLLAVTNTITFDLAPIPLFWIVPLSIYLFSFFLTFKRRMWYPAFLEDRFPTAVIVGVFLFLMMIQSYRLPVWILFALHLTLLFIVCMSCHALLVRSRPDSIRHLTVFYILISLGSFLGSVLVSWAIPLVSTAVVEYPVALILAVLARKSTADPDEPRRMKPVFLLLLLSAALVSWPVGIALLKPQTGNLFAAGFGLIIALIFHAMRNRKMVFSAGLVLVVLLSYFIDDLRIGQRVLHKHRNFYGIYTVVDRGEKRYLNHGTTLHGSQFVSPERRHEALTYYHITAPAGEILDRFPEDIQDAGLVGLGAGSLLTYISRKQTADVFELDPHNGMIAETYFYFVEDCAGPLRMFFGDARVRLRDVADRSYSVLVVDAFNSDAIPVHLLTVEAISEYFDRIDDEGILLFHISNKYLDLSPVILANGRALGLFALRKRYLHNIHPDAEACEWAALTKSPAWAGRLMHELQWTDLSREKIKEIQPWTDRYTNLLAVIR